MSEYVITCCSTVDLSKATLDERGIPYAMFHYRIGSEEFLDDLYSSITPEKFYQDITDGAEPVTSQVNADEYIALWKPFLDEGKDILHITLSSGISGTFNSANVARDMIKEDYPKRQVVVVDSLAASAGYGMLVMAARDNQDKGMSIGENAAWVVDNRNKLHHWFFSTDLTSYIRGGRVSKASGLVGTMLKICPLLNVNCEGKLIARNKCRGKKKAIAEAFAQMQNFAQNGRGYRGTCYMSHSMMQEDAKALADMIEAYFTNMDGKVHISQIGTVIGSHTGPGTVALFFWGNERTE